MEINAAYIKIAHAKAEEVTGEQFNWILLNPLDYRDFMLSIGRDEREPCYKLDDLAIAPSAVEMKRGDFGAMYIKPIGYEPMPIALLGEPSLLDKPRPLPVICYFQTGK